MSSIKQAKKAKTRTEFLNECRMLAEIVSEAGGKATVIFVTEKQPGRSVQTCVEYECNNEEIRLEIERQRIAAAAAAAAAAAPAAGKK